MIITWSGVASVIVGAVIRNELVPDDYLPSFYFASFIYGLGWAITIGIDIAITNDKR